MCVRLPVARQRPAILLQDRSYFEILAIGRKPGIYGAYVAVQQAVKAPDPRLGDALLAHVGDEGGGLIPYEPAEGPSGPDRRWY